MKERKINSKSKKNILVMDAAAKSAIPVLEQCAAMGLNVIAASEHKYCCGFFSRAAKDTIRYPSPKGNEQEWLEFILSYIKNHDIEVIIPLAEDTYRVAKYQDQIREYANLLLSPYDIFMKGLDKIQTMKVAQQVSCPVPLTWFPADEKLCNIVTKAVYPLLIKPAISCGARGLKICESPDEVEEHFPKIEKEYGECFVQEYIPQNGMQYKCAMILDECHEVMSVFVYAKLRYYPIKGGSSTLNKSVYMPDIVANCIRVAKCLKWVGPCDFDLITDPRDNVIKLMEINPRFSDTYKMAQVVELDFVKILYNLATGQKAEPQFDYKVNKYLRFIFGDILWFLKVGPGRWKTKPSFFKFFGKDLTYLMTGTNDFGPIWGYILENSEMLWNSKLRKHRIR
jgi:D-aspartate ligase